MEREAAHLQLSDSLEDYLETTYQLVQASGFARVRDIARERDVKPASVSQAIQRLAELKLVNYQKRGFLTLTPEGEEQARRILARHQVLSRLFIEILRIDPETATRDACVMEHGLSIETMDRIVKFFEFVENCPDAGDIIERFHQCARIHDDAPNCDHRCAHHGPPHRAATATPLASLGPWKRCQVVRITGSGSIRQRLLDMGILPGAVLEIERLAPAGDPMWIRLGGFQLSLRRNEAEMVLVEPL